MARVIGTFGISLVAALAIAFAAMWYGEGPKPLSWVAALSLLLSAAFSLAGAYLGFYPRPTLAGLTSGALLVLLCHKILIPSRGDRTKDSAVSK